MAFGNTVRTAEKDKRFFEEFSRTANITAAAQLAGYSRSTVYKYYHEDPEFARQWVEAEKTSTEHLEEALYNRAVFGTTRIEPIVYKGKIIFTREITEYSDTAAIFLLKARNPDKYRERLEVNINWRQEARALGVNPDEYLQIMIDQARQQLEANADVIDVTPTLELESGDLQDGNTAPEGTDRAH